ncbi:hypothetical protein ACU8DI_08895 [Psychroserpens sp. BH13MA-6]
MRTIKLAKLLLAFSLVTCIGLATSHILAQSNNTKTDNDVEDIHISIDKSTSNTDFESITKTLANYGITATFDTIKRNDNDEITSISLHLSSEDGQQTMTQMSSNTPISKISFGMENGQLYIGKNSGHSAISSIFQHSQKQPFTFNRDSMLMNHMRILNNFNIDDYFNDKNSVFMFNGDSLTIEELKDKMMQNFSFKNPSEDRFSFIFSDEFDTSNGRYQFIDNPEKEKIIIIDGKVSDFKTLDQLAKADKIDKVDTLKPETAMSVYGSKAKDGAIIVTTK